MRSFPHPKIAGFGQSVFTEMSQLARTHNAVNLGQGFPDFPGPEFVKEAAVKAIREDRNQYAVSHGDAGLRREIAATWSADYGLPVDPDAHVTVTSGATEAIFGAIQAFLGPGDEIIAFEPFYDSYPAAASLAGATFVPVRLEPPTWDFKLTELQAAITPRTRAILLNSPHNPTGKVFGSDDLADVARVSQQHDLLVITDEVYDRILFDAAVHVPLASLPGMWERTITIGSTGKTFSLTGWKIGYAIAPAELSAALRSVHQFITFSTSTPFQVAMAEALAIARSNGYYDHLRDEYEERRQFMTSAMRGASLEPMAIGGSYFLTADVSKFGFESDVAFCRWLIESRGVAAIPPSAFYQHPATAPVLARFCFAKSRATLEEAARRLEGLSAS